VVDYPRQSGGAAMQKLTAFGSYLFSMGGLHDSVCDLIEWHPSQRRLTFHIVDLYSNFLDLPEYPGLTGGFIELLEVSKLTLSIESPGPFRVFEFLPLDGESDVVKVAFSPGGYLEARFGAVNYPSNQLRQ
jgi:hypothetical protein